MYLYKYLYLYYYSKYIEMHIFPWAINEIAIKNHGKKERKTKKGKRCHELKFYDRFAFTSHRWFST